MPRPLSSEERDLVLSMGKDPEGMVYYEPGEYEKINSPVQSAEPEQTTALGAGVRGAARNVIPGIGGGLGMMAGAAFAPETGGLSLAVPLIASLIGGGIASAAQKPAIGAISPELLKRYEQSEQQDVKEHPYASEIGGLLGAGAGGGLRPGLSPLKYAAQGANNILKGRTLATIPSEQANSIRNVIGGTTLNTGIEAGRQVYNGQFDPLALGGAAASGAVLNTPTAVGKAFGFHATSPESAPTPQPDQVITSEGNVLTPEQVEIQTKQKGAIAKQDFFKNLQRQQQPTTPIAPVPNAPVVEPKINPQQVEKALGVKTNIPSPKLLLTAGEAIKQNEIPLEQREPGSGIAVEPEARKRYQEENPNTELARVSPEDISRASVEASRRGITLGRSEEPIIKPTGERAAGVSNPNRTAAVDPSVATKDTPTHEILEGFLDDLSTSKSPRDQALAKQLIDAFPDTGEGSRENLAQMGGVAYADRLSQQASSQPLAAKAKNWLKDVHAAFKQRFGTLEPEQAARFLVNESQGRKSFGSDEALQGGNKQQRFQTATLPERNLYGKGIDPSTEPTFKLEDARPKVITEEDKYALHYPNPVQRMIEPATEKVAHIGGADAPIEVKKVNRRAADSLEGMFRQETRLNGLFRENFVRSAEQSKINAEESRKLHQYRYDMSENGKSALQGWYDSARPEIKKFNENYQNLLVEGRLLQNKEGLDVSTSEGGGRSGKIEPFYDPAIVDQSVRREVTENTTSTKAKELRNELVEFWKKKGLKDADKIADDYIQALGSHIVDREGKEFAALRRAKGFGLPFSWTEKGVVHQGARYFARYAKDLAYFKSIQSDPVARSIFNIPDQYGTKELNATHLEDATPIKENNGIPSNKYAQKAFDSSLKYQSDIESSIFAVSRAVTSGWLGPWSGLRDLTTSILHTLPYARTTDIAKNLVPAIKDFSKYYEDSFRTGVNRSKVNAIEFGSESVNAFSDRLSKFSDLMSQFQGRNLLEKITRGVQFGLGKEVARTVLFRGNPEEVNTFIRNFGKGINGVESYAGKNAPDNVLNEMAAQWVEHNQGTYDARGLPSGAVKGQFAGLLSLARWGIEKQNTMYKDVWLPAVIDRDIKPLLKVTLGMFMGGEAVRKLGEIINNRLDFVPNWSEIASSSDKKKKENITANLVSAANMAGYFGITSQLASSAFGLLQGKPWQQIVTIPAGDFLSQNIGLHTQDFIQALHSGEPLDKAFMRYVNTIARDQVQSIKILEENTIGRGDQERKKKLRDVAVFRQLEGTNHTDYNYHPQEITGMSGRDFDRATTAEEASKSLPGAVNVAVNQSKGDPTKLISNLRAIPRQEDQSIPNPSTPEGARELMRYKKFITETKGPEAWNSILQQHISKLSLDAQKKALFGQYLNQNRAAIKNRYEAVGMR